RGAGGDEGDANLRVAIARVDQRERCRLLHLPGADLFVLEPPPQGGDQLLAAGIAVSVDRNLHAHMIPSVPKDLSLPQVFEEASHGRPDRLRTGRRLDGVDGRGLAADGAERRAVLLPDGPDALTRSEVRAHPPGRQG